LVAKQRVEARQDISCASVNTATDLDVVTHINIVKPERLDIRIALVLQPGLRIESTFDFANTATGSTRLPTPRYATRQPTPTNIFLS
jgi:hypothetical protein